MNGAEVVVDPGQSGIVDAIGRNKKILWMVTLGGNELGDR